jgi:hypothetical protein
MNHLEIKLSQHELEVIKNKGYITKQGNYSGIIGKWGFCLGLFSEEIIVQKLDNQPGEFFYGSYDPKE